MVDTIIPILNGCYKPTNITSLEQSETGEAFFRKTRLRNAGDSRRFLTPVFGCLWKTPCTSQDVPRTLFPQRKAWSTSAPRWLGPCDLQVALVMRSGWECTTSAEGLSRVCFFFRWNMNKLRRWSVSLQTCWVLSDAFYGSLCALVPKQQLLPRGQDKDCCYILSKTCCNDHSTFAFCQVYWCELVEGQWPVSFLSRYN